MNVSSPYARTERADVPAARHSTRRERRRQRLRLAEQARLAAQLAELARVRDLAAEARALVAAGWLQHAWFGGPDDRGGRLRVGLAAGGRSDLPVEEACLVGAVLHAGGGVAAARTQLVQRTFDLTWHTLRRGAGEPVRWCPAPPVRAQHLRELVRWNDEPRRTRADVEALLASVERAADREADRGRARLATLAGTP